MRARIGLVLGIVMGVSGTALGVTGGQVDTFQDGTVQNWSGGATPTNIPTGGPTGAGDRYLQCTTTGSNMATYNLTQWSGNYTAAAINDIGVDMRDAPGGQTLVARLVLFGPTGSRWTSTTPFTVSPDGLWHHFTFSMRAADLVNVLPTGDTYAQTVGNLQRLMFRHDDGPPSSNGTAFTGSMGIDNVSAVVPEPASIALLPAVCLILRRRRR